MPKYWITPEGETPNIAADFLKQTHLLIAGSTGSGKSVVLNSIIYTALYKSPSSVSFILCDPKRVELRRYKDLPHVLRFANSLETIADALQLGYEIMDSRTNEMEQKGLIETEEGHLYIIIDEFAKLVSKGLTKEESVLKKRCETLIENIGELGRSAHVHLILATQSPNRETIKANIKLNMTATLALKCVDPIESRQLLRTDEALYLPDPKEEHRAEGIYKKGFKAERVKLPKIDDAEIDRVIKWWMDQKPAASTKVGGFFRQLFGTT